MSLFPILHLDAKNALTSNEVGIIFYNDHQLFYCLVFFNDKLNFTIETKKAEAMVIDNVISVLQKIHLLNSHLGFYVNEYDCNIFLLNSKSLLFPLMNDVIKSFECIFQQSIEEEQRIIEHWAINDNEAIDLLIIYHTYLSIGAFDLMIFNNRLINQKAMNDILLNQKFISIMKGDYGLLIEGSQLSTVSKKNFPKNYSVVIIANFIRDGIDNDIIINNICDCLETKSEEYSGKIRNYVNNINLNLNFHIIKQSLAEVYHLTHNCVLYEKLKQLLENKETFENKLFDSFIKGRYSNKEEKENE